MASLKVTVPQDSQNIVGVVSIRAPLARVFAAYTDPALFARWWCRGNPVTVHHFDCRDGGSWHITEDRDGMIASGAEAGWRESVEALGQLLEQADHE